MSELNGNGAYTLGDILVKMGVLKPEDLEKALEFQKGADKDELLGKILIATFSCSPEVVDTAMNLQKGFRSEDLAAQAKAAVALATARKRITRNANIDMMYRGAKALQRVRGDEFTPVFGIQLPVSGNGKG